MNLIILFEDDKIDKNLYQVSDIRFQHIKTILKSDIGDFIQIGLINGPIGDGIITEMNENYASIQVQNTKIQHEEHSQIDIICALPRPQTLKKVLATSATMGVRNLYLIRSEKVEKSYFHSPLLEEKNYIKFLIEGLSQGKRTKIPNVTVYKKFKEFFTSKISETFNDSTCLIAHPDGCSYLDSSFLKTDKNIILAIGPEGGWNDFEVNLMCKLGFTKFKLSESILRVENAVTASLAQIELISHQNI